MSKFNKAIDVFETVPMKPLRQVLKYITLALLCFSLIVACNGNRQQNPSTSNTNSPPRNGRIVIGTTLKPRTLDPADSYEAAGLNIIYNVAESLYTYKVGTTELIPLLAEAMPKISDDGLVYTIPLRKGVKFHDGTPFNAEAMKFSLDRFIQNGGKPSFLLSDIVKDIKVSGEYQLTITLKKPFAAFASLLAFPGACAVSPKSYTIGEGQFKPNELVGTGPYKLVSFDGDSISLTPFSDYWGEKPANQGIDIQIYAGNSANLYNSFLTGAIDVAYQTFAPPQITSLLQQAKNGSFQVLQGKGTVISYLVLNRNQPPLDKPEVRKAIASLIQRSLFIERVLQGQAEPLYSLIPTVFDVSLPVFQQGEGDIELAKKLLTKAGFSASNPAVVEIWYPSASKVRSGVASTLRALAEEKLGGIIQFVPSGVESATAFSNLGKGVYASFLGDWYPDFLDADNYIQPFLQCTRGDEKQGCVEGGAQTQGSFYYNGTVNQLIDQQRQEKQEAKRKAIFAQIQKILAEDVPYIPLWQNKDYVFFQNSIEGVYLNPSQQLPFWTLKTTDQTTKQ
ncbi:MAG: ABC transporter substrate-binding protein [Geminocystis sp.]|nr:ABC transporter substrate-binding protein [Geminocystis sp.]MDW8116917.1 ABC transporter substrate-binding protein [Geminocystis sp.]